MVKISKYLQERSNTSVPTCTTHVLWERRPRIYRPIQLERFTPSKKNVFHEDWRMLFGIELFSWHKMLFNL